MRRIIGRRAGKLKGNSRNRAGQRRARKVRRRARRNANRKRSVRHVVPKGSTLHRLLLPLATAIPLAIDPSHEAGLFPVLSMAGMLITGLLFHLFHLRSMRDAVAKVNNTPEVKVGRVCLSTFSDAVNSKRRLKYLRLIFANLVTLFCKQCSGSGRLKTKFKHIGALDSTLIQTVPSAKWATYRKKVKALKGHILFRLAEGIPSKLVISAGRLHDRKFFECFLERGWTYIVDRAYNAYKVFDEMIELGIHVVTRLKSNASYEVIKSNKVKRSQKKKGVISDQIVRLGSGKTLMENVMRLITYEDENDKIFRFLTTRKDLAPASIAQLYHARWSIEIFFKWLKRTLRGARLLGRSEQAGENHVLIALIADILLKMFARSVSPSWPKKNSRHVPVAFLRVVRDKLLKRLTPSIQHLLQVSLE